jgi:dTDP-4-amino-4,6-dideoxygalactose transaminase
MKVDMVGIRQQYEHLKPQIDAAIASVVSRGAFIGGPEVVEFERWFGEYCGVPHAIGVGSGTAAIELVLRALGAGPGDEVITAANTFIATAAAISTTGARPVLVDVDERTGNLDPERLAAAITSRTKAIVPVHLYGRPAAMREILQAAGGVPVIEDAAQAHGARYGGARVGSLATAACFSFYPTKNLGAFGDAGLVATGDDTLAAKVKLLRDHGRIGKYEHAIVGYTARLDNLQAAVLRVQADCLDEWNARRRRVAASYRERLPPAVLCPADDPGNESVYHQFAIRVQARDRFREHLDARGVATAIHYPVPLHLQPAYRGLGHHIGDFPATERLAAEVVSLPMHPFLELADVQYVADAATEFFMSTHRVTT